jgi:hypothetical protein
MEFKEVLHKNEWIEINSIQETLTSHRPRPTLLVNDFIKLNLRSRIRYFCNRCNTFVERNFKFQNHTLCQKCKLEETNMVKYGVKSNLQLESTKEQIKKTCLEKYGFESANSNEDVKLKKRRSYLDKYGVDNPLKNKDILNKVKKTNLDRYGVEFWLENQEAKEKAVFNKYGVKNIMFLNSTVKKIKETNIKKYGVEHLNQHPEFHKKIMSAFGRRVKLKKISECLHYQTQPELDCIKYHQDNNIKIWDGPSINYNLNGENHVYHIDFETNNYLIEIKSNHGGYKKNLASGKIDAKNKAAIEYAKSIGKEFKFLLDVDNYEDLL